jgi:CRISPR-associated protein Csh1
MIHEISKFIEFLEENSPEVFDENIELEEGLYVFLEKENGELVIKDENVLEVKKDTEKNNLYKEFLKRKSVTEMLSNEKSFNAGPKIYVKIGSPFGISFSGKGYKSGKENRLTALDAYFKTAEKYIDKDNQKYLKWLNEFKDFAYNKLFQYLESINKYQNVSDKYMFYFYLKEPELEDFQNIYSKYLSERIFNDNGYNIPRTKKDTLPDADTYGIPNSLSGFNSKKPFLEHKTAPNEINMRVNLKVAFNLQKFFDLQKKNKILPNPMPIFVDEDELTNKTIKFYKDGTKKTHREIIEYLLTQSERENLQNFYLIYFQNGLKGSRITDLDFVPVFKYKTDDMPEIEAIFNVKSKEKGELLHDYKINNVFEFQEKIVNKIFNHQLIQETKNGIWLKYYDEEIKINPEYGATETIINLLYKYRKAFYDYIYKSKQQSITFKIFYDIMSNSILDDIKHDKDYDKTFSIKEKLNIWFSLYSYFSQSKNINMVNKTKELFEKIKQIGNPSSNERIMSDEEFAFASGQLIREILSKSETAERTHALLEPFLQKTDIRQFKLAIAKAFDTYKHSFKFYKGNARYEFDKIMSEVMGFEPDEKNMKNLLPFILAGYFSESIFKKEKDTDTDSKTETNNIN